MSPPRAPPTMGPAQYIQCWTSQVPVTRTGARLLAGLMLAPVYGPPIRPAAVTVNPSNKCDLQYSRVLASIFGQKEEIFLRNSISYNISPIAIGARPGTDFVLVSTAVE